jgi:hypothetical protein
MQRLCQSQPKLKLEKPTFAVTLLFVYRKPVDMFYLRVQLLVMTLLWGFRVVMQLVYPQDTINPATQYGMLSVFVLSLMLFLIAYLSVI